MRHVLAVALALAVVTRGAEAQNEAALRAALEGRTVTVRLDMPATSQGVDVFPQDAQQLDVRELADRLKANGTALRVRCSRTRVRSAPVLEHYRFRLCLSRISIGFCIPA